MGVKCGQCRGDMEVIMSIIIEWPGTRTNGCSLNGATAGVLGITTYIEEKMTGLIILVKPQFSLLTAV